LDWSHLAWEGKKEKKIGGSKVTRKVKRREQLLEDLTEMTGYWKLKEGAIYRTLCRTKSLGKRL
jgi:hypothetical protein